MDWTLLGTSLATLASGGAIGASVTWRVASKQLAFEREKYAVEHREEQQARLAPLTRKTLEILKATDTFYRGMAASDEERGISRGAYGRLLKINLDLLEDLPDEWLIADRRDVAESIETLAVETWALLHPEELAQGVSVADHAHKCLRASEKTRENIVQVFSYRLS